MKKLNNYTILGKNTTLNLNDFETKLNNNVIVEGTSGCGKTRSIVIPNILNANCSYVVVDAKGLIYAQTKDFMKEQGYNIKVLNLRNLELSNSFNPFYFIKSASDIRRISELIVSEGQDWDPFWPTQARNYLDTFIAMMLTFNDIKYINFEELLKISSSFHDRKKISEIENFINRVKGYLSENELFKIIDDRFQGMINPSENTYKSIMSVLSSPLFQISNPEILKMTKTNDFDFKELGKKKTIYYIIVSDTDRSKDFITNIFFDIAFQELVDYADSLPNQRLRIPVRFIMDDFATNIDVSSNFPSLISSIRSRNISTMIMIQDVGQLIHKFGHNADAVIGNNSVYIYMGNNNIESARRISDYTDMTPDEVLCISNEKEIILISGKKYKIDYKYNIENHKNYCKLKASPTIEMPKAKIKIGRKVL